MTFYETYTDQFWDVDTCQKFYI